MSEQVPHFEEIIGEVFGADERQYYTEQLDELWLPEPLEWGRQRLLNCFDRIIIGRQKLEHDNPDYKMMALHSLVQNMDIELQAQLQLDSVSSFWLPNDTDQKWSVTSKKPYIQGAFGGLQIGGWYDISAETAKENDDHSLYWRPNGLHVIVFKPSIFGLDEGVVEADVVLVPLNHGAPELSRLVSADQYDDV